MFLTKDGDPSLRLPPIIRVTRDYNARDASDVVLIQIIFFLAESDGTVHRFVIDFEPDEMTKISDFYRDTLHGLVEVRKDELLHNKLSDDDMAYR